MEKNLNSDGRQLSIIFRLRFNYSIMLRTEKDIKYVRRIKNVGVLMQRFDTTALLRMFSFKRHVAFKETS